MCDYKKMSSELIKYIFGILMTVIGFMITNAYNRTNESLVKLNTDIIQLRIDVSEINAKMLTDERVNQLIDLKLAKLEKQ